MILYDKFTQLFEFQMKQHIVVKKSFFIRFLLLTAISGNIYVLFQSIFHIMNIHSLDFYLRWYPFKVAPLYNLLLVLSSTIVIYGLSKILKSGLSGFKTYFIGKVIAAISYSILIMLDYKISSLPFPTIIVPVLWLVQMIYPLFLYISLRKSKIQ